MKEISAVFERIIKQQRNVYVSQEENDMKKVLFVASEGVPFIKTGGLADVVGSLPKCFDKSEYDVRVILPKYMCIKEEWAIR